MSLAVDGTWKAGVWAPTVWANGVWREGQIIAVVQTPAAAADGVGPMGGTFGPIPLEMPSDLYDEREELELAELATLIIRMLA